MQYKSFPAEIADHIKLSLKAGLEGGGKDQRNVSAVSHV